MGPLKVAAHSCVVCSKPGLALSKPAGDDGVDDDDDGSGVDDAV